MTVTELLLCRRVEEETHLSTEQVEDVVQTAMRYSEEKFPRAYKTKNPQGRRKFFAAAAVGLAEIILCRTGGGDILFVMALVPYLLAAIFGGYFWFLVREKLPQYYDENRVCAYSDGILHLNMAGMCFNNRNWPHIINFFRTWAALVMVITPSLALVGTLLPMEAQRFMAALIFTCFMFSLFAGLYKAGKKYER